MTFKFTFDEELGKVVFPHLAKVLLARVVDRILLVVPFQMLHTRTDFSILSVLVRQMSQIPFFLFPRLLEDCLGVLCLGLLEPLYLLVNACLELRAHLFIPDRSRALVVEFGQLEEVVPL